MTERSESERAELVALADLIDNATGVEVCTFDPMRLEHKRTHLSDDGIARLGSGLAALRRLAAQDQKPVAWVIPTGDNVRDNGFIDCMAWEEGEFTKPLYPKPFPPPAAGWDELLQWLDSEIETASCLQRAAFQNGKDRMGDQYWSGHTTLLCVKQKVEALRHNAPPDSGAEKSEALSPEEKAALNETRWKNVVPLEECSLPEWEWEDCEFRRALPDHGGADAGVEEGWSCGSCGDKDVPEKFRVFGSCYRCAAQHSIDKRESKIARLERELEALSKPVAANTSAEARLREVLEFYAREWQTNMEGDSETPGLSRCWREPTDNLLHDEGVRAREALSAHPHASDCDKSDGAIYAEISRRETPPEEQAALDAAVDKALKDPAVCKALERRPHASDCDKQGER